MHLPSRIELLGGLCVVQTHRRIERFQTQKTGALLGYLALNVDKPQPREFLAELLWPEGDPTAIRNRLNQAVSSLRRQLHPPEMAGSTILIADHHTVCLNTAEVSIDWVEFRNLVRKASHAPELEEIDLLSQAVNLYQGHLMSGYYEDWLQNYRLEAQDQYATALSRLVELLRGQGDFDRCIEMARRMTQLDPLDEVSQLELIELYLDANRPKSAMRQIEQFELELRTSGFTVPDELRSLRERAAEESRAPRIREVSEHPRAAAAPATPMRRSTDKNEPALPRPFTRFLGREAELSLIVDKIKTGTRLVTLLGTAGCGKTRLAIEAGWQLGESFQGRVFFVSLAPPVDPSDVSSAIIRGIKPSTQSHDHSVQDIIAELRSLGPTLLILDNLEQSVDATASTLQDLFQATPDLFCIATSAHPLELAAEQLVVLTPLPLPSPETTERLLELAENPAVALFVNRAQSVRPDFQLTERTAPSIVSLCRRLEGIPLAIELAAGWVRILTPNQMLEQMKERFDLLESRRRDIPERHRSMRAAIEASYMLLGDKLKAAFVKCSVFEGGWSVAAAMKVVGDADTALALQQLVDRSMLVIEHHENESRFGMLDTVRAFALAQLSPDLSAECRWQHADYFLSFLESLEDTRDSGAKAIDADYANILAALAWFEENKSVDQVLRMAAILSEYWMYRGRIEEGRAALLRITREASGAGSSLNWAKATAALGHLHWVYGEYEAGKELLEAAVPTFEEHQDHASIINTKFGLHLEAHRLADYEVEEKILNEILQAAVESGSNLALTKAHLALGNLYVEQLRWDEAREFYHRALMLARETGDPDRIATALNNLANLALHAGEHHAARQWIIESLEHAKPTGYRGGIVIALVNYTRVCIADGDLDEALNQILEAITLKAEEGYVEWRVFLQASYLCIKLELFKEAAQLMGFVESLQLKSGDNLIGVELKEYQSQRAVLCEKIPAALFHQHWQIGRSMTYSESLRLMQGIHETRVTRSCK